MTFNYFIDGQKVGTYTPSRVDELKKSKFNFAIGAGCTGPGCVDVSPRSVTGYFDDVRVGPISPTNEALQWSAVWSNAMSCQSGTWRAAEHPPADVNSPWLTNQVKLDGRISTAQEWSDAICLDLVLADRHTGPATLSSRWWVKNDAWWLYLLARVPATASLGDGAYIEYFWPHPYTGRWKHSDLGYIGLDSVTFDGYGWNESEWSDDTKASPPGKNNVEGAASSDTFYRWFEFRKALFSGDGYDWSWVSGQTVGTDGDLLVGIYDSKVATPFEVNMRFHLGSP
jgi:hypothetical protein